MLRRGIPAHPDERWGCPASAYDDPDRIHLLCWSRSFLPHLQRPHQSPCTCSSGSDPTASQHPHTTTTWGSSNHNEHLLLRKSYAGASWRSSCDWATADSKDDLALVSSSIVKGSENTALSESSTSAAIHSSLCSTRVPGPTTSLARRKDTGVETTRSRTQKL